MRTASPKPDSPRALALVSLITLLGTSLWLVLMIASGPPPETFEAMLPLAPRLNTLFYLSFLNAAFLVTLPATLLMTLLSVYCKPYLSEGARLVGLVFVPVYCLLNLFAYLSQVTLVPLLAQLHEQPAYRSAAELMLRLSLQALPDSVVGFANGLAYGILAIPSILFGVALYRRGGRAHRAGGLLLALNGAACILGVAGYLLKNAVLSFGVVLGGGLFFLALFPMTWAFWKSETEAEP